LSGGRPCCSKPSTSWPSSPMLRPARRRRGAGRWISPPIALRAAISSPCPRLMLLHGVRLLPSGNRACRTSSAAPCRSRSAAIQKLKHPDGGRQECPPSALQPARPCGRPARALPGQRASDLRAVASPGPAGAQSRCLGPRQAAGRPGAAEGPRHAAAAAGRKRPARGYKAVHPGPAPAGGA
jgi:hypothetical protein